MDKIYLINLEHINGFPCVSCESFLCEKDARKQMNCLRTKNADYYGEDYPPEENNENCFFVEDGKGNSYELFIESREKMLDCIKSEVDDSFMEDFETPAREISWDNASIVSDEDKYSYEVKYITKDSVKDNKSKFVYIVHMIRYEAFIKNSSEEICTMNLDDVPGDILAHIYCDFRGM